jgi:hypothetical protein
VIASEVARAGLAIGPALAAGAGTRNRNGGDSSANARSRMGGDIALVIQKENEKAPTCDHGPIQTQSEAHSCTGVCVWGGGWVGGSDLVEFTDGGPHMRWGCTQS